MKAEKLLDLKRMHGPGIVEIVVWRVPASIFLRAVPPDGPRIECGVTVCCWDGA